MLTACFHAEQTISSLSGTALMDIIVSSVLVVEPSPTLVITDYIGCLAADFPLFHPLTFLAFTFTVTSRVVA